MHAFKNGIHIILFYLVMSFYSWWEKFSLKLLQLKFGFTKYLKKILREKTFSFLLWFYSIFQYFCLSFLHSFVRKSSHLYRSETYQYFMFSPEFRSYNQLRFYFYSFGPLLSFSFLFSNFKFIWRYFQYFFFYFQTFPCNMLSYCFFPIVSFICFGKMNFLEYEIFCFCIFLFYMIYIKYYVLTIISINIWFLK